MRWIFQPEPGHYVVSSAAWPEGYLLLVTIFPRGEDVSPLPGGIWKRRKVHLSGILYPPFKGTVCGSASSAARRPGVTRLYLRMILQPWLGSPAIVICMEKAHIRCILLNPKVAGLVMNYRITAHIAVVDGNKVACHRCGVNLAVMSISMRKQRLLLKDAGRLAEALSGTYRDAPRVWNAFWPAGDRLLPP